MDRRVKCPWSHCISACASFRSLVAMPFVSSNKCHATSNKCLTGRNKKLLETSATLLVTSALLVGTRSY